MPRRPSGARGAVHAHRPPVGDASDRSLEAGADEQARDDAARGRPREPWLRPARARRRRLARQDGAPDGPGTAVRGRGPPIRGGRRGPRAPRARRAPVRGPARLAPIPDRRGGGVRGGVTVRSLEVVPNAAAVARRGADEIATAASAAIAARARFTLAVSGGNTPLAMFRVLADEDIAWEAVGIWQVDERVAPDGDPDRNLTSLTTALPAAVGLHPMPVTEDDLEAAAERYAASLPDVFDLVHLGMGDDGHTASLVPGDPVLEVTDRDVALIREYRGRRRMTMTYPPLGRARRVLWLIAGE